MPTQPLPYPTGIVPGGNLLRGQPRKLENVRFSNGQWVTRGGNIVVYSHTIQRDSQFKAENASLTTVRPNEGVGLYPYRQTGVCPLLISVWRVQEGNGAMEISVSRGPRALILDSNAAVLANDSMGYEAVSFARLNRTVYMAGPFARGIRRAFIPTSDRIDLGILRPIDRVEFPFSPFDDEGPWLKTSPVFKYMTTQGQRVVGVDSKLTTRLRKSNLNDGDAYASLNYQDAAPGGPITGIHEIGGKLVIGKRDRILIGDENVATQEPGAIREVENNPYREGPVSHHSMAKTPYGVPFLGRRGIYMLAPTTEREGFRIEKLVDLSAFFGDGQRSDGYVDSHGYQIISDRIAQSRGIYVPSKDMYVVYVPATYSGAAFSGDIVGDVTDGMSSSNQYGVQGWYNLGLCYSFGQGAGFHIDQGRAMHSMAIDVNENGVERWLACTGSGSIHTLDVGDTDSYTRLGKLQTNALTAQVNSVVGGVCHVDGPQFRMPRIEALLEPKSEVSADVLAKFKYWTDQYRNDTGAVNYLETTYPYRGIESPLVDATLPLTMRETERSAAGFGARSSTGRSVSFDLTFNGRLTQLRVNLEKHAEFLQLNGT